MSYPPGACMFCDLGASSKTDSRSINTVTPCVIQDYLDEATGYYKIKVVRHGEWVITYAYKNAISSNTIAGDN